MGILANENAISSGGYQIANSLRFQSASSTYLSRTPASAGNQQKFTYSLWVKRGILSTDYRNMLSSGTSGTARTDILFDAGLGGTDDLLFIYSNGANNYGCYTSAVFRDPSAWYHIVISVDTTQATAANRVLMYVNGVQQTTNANPTYGFVPQNTNLFINSTNAHRIGSNAYSVGSLFDGYMAEVNFIDGQALTPSSFGETNALTGQWVAKKYSGTYGTNGFYLPFSNGTSTTTLGADSSGNGNNWTLNNFTRSAGVSDCWMYDVPSGNGGVAGTQPNSNYCVLNPLKVVGGNTAASAGNLNASSSANSWGTRFTTVGMTTGKWYWELIRTGNTYGASGGMATDQLTAGDLTGTGAIGWAENGQFCNEAAGYSGSSKTWVTGDVLQFRYDADVGQLDINVNNGTWVTLVTGKSGRTWFPVTKCYGGSDALSINLGNRSFAYTPPTGFKALCTANLPTSTIVKGNQYMDATLYTGTNANLTVTNAGAFAVDMLWLKSRSVVSGFTQYDSVRGANKVLTSAGTNAEGTSTAGTAVTAFNNNGFSLGTETSSYGSTNINAATYVAYQWKAGAGTTSSNTSGSITSTVSVNATAGFSIVTRTGTGVAGTIGHGLGVAPKMIINKSRSSSSYNWSVYHASLTNANYVVYLDATNAQQSEPTAWNGTAPTSSVFSVGTSAQTNLNTATYVSYCFAEIAGFSKFGSYTGNGSTDGTFVYTGFTPKFVMIKGSSTNTAWFIYDSVRNTYNLTTQILYPNLSDAETTSTSYQLDLLSNGFKLRGAGTGFNGSGETIIYAAFASNPFSASNAR